MVTAMTDKFFHVGPFGRCLSMFGKYPFFEGFSVAFGFPPMDSTRNSRCCGNSTGLVDHKMHVLLR